MVEVKTGENYAKKKDSSVCRSVRELGKFAVKFQKIDVVAAAVAYGKPSTAMCVVVKECIRQPVKDSRRTITDEG
jgi:hypothetical protein